MAGLHLARRLLHGEGVAQFVQELLGAIAVKVFEQAVVVEDLHLVVGEDHRQEIVVGLFSRVARIGGPARRGHARGGGGAVVAIRDVEAIHGVEGAGDEIEVRRVAHHPKRVTDAGVGDEVGLGRRRGRLGREFIDCGIVLVGEEHRARLGAERVHLADAVVLLVRAGEFVLADAALVVVGHAGGGDEARLLVAAHDQPVEIIAGGAVLLQHPFRKHAVEVLLALGVDRRAVGIGAGRQIDLGLGDVKEAPGLAGGAFAGLLAVEHVIGGRGHFGGFIGKRDAGRGRGERAASGVFLVARLNAAY